ncbi:MAG TPA: hypothetical protein VLJ86_18970 [Ramlibacter sp.]|nr:hypothetical protein [Ramlibacter sp.]
MNRLDKRFCAVLKEITTADASEMDDDTPQHQLCADFDQEMTALYAFDPDLYWRKPTSDGDKVASSSMSTSASQSLSLRNGRIHTTDESALVPNFKDADDWMAD